MNGKKRFWMVCFVIGCFAFVLGSSPHVARALETPNVLMSIDGMTINHAGLFRNLAYGDGANTFQFGDVNWFGGTLGRYKSFHTVVGAEGACCSVQRNRLESWSPIHWQGTEYGTVAPLDISNAYFPVIDRAGYSQLFEPDEYEIEVKFRPNTAAPWPMNQWNQAPTFAVSLDQHYGFVWDAEVGQYKRATEQIIYTFGSEETPINQLYADMPKDADGFITMSIPVNQPNFSQRSFYYNFGDGTFRTDHTLAGGGRALVFNEETQTEEWQDVTIGYGENFQIFGGGPSDPNRPGSKLDTPNGVTNLSFGGSPNFNVEFKSVALKRINPTPLVARIDANSGLSFRFGSGFTRGTTAAPIVIPGDPLLPGGYIPQATDQISRFDENGMTNLFINMRTPDDPNEVHRFFLRSGPGANTFDGTEAMVNVRARLLEPLTNPGIAQSLTLVAKDLDGNDTAANPFGADEYTYNLALNQFNTSTFTTVSIPLTDFMLSEHTPRDDVGGFLGSGPAGFVNPGDGLLTDFNLYEFGGLIPSNGGLLRLELEFMEIRLATEPGCIAGDFNCNGAVENADLTLLLNNWGAAVPPIPAGWTGTAPTAPAIDNDELTALLNNWGSVAGGGSLASTAVPEPASWVLGLMVLAMLGVIRCRPGLAA